ncbi:hypothetical protein HYW55_00455 [Candidatus Gottesmanbacteria bacterium]|nr:hypothetical protein [Candidatus Gottesmanbacteria bacterium]
MVRQTGNMNVAFDPEFYEKLKKVDVRIRILVRERIKLFSKNPYDPQLNNHLLHREYSSQRSINITSDYRAIYKEIWVGDEVVAYFVLLGTHEELYG